MPQDFHVLRCYSCSIFQVHIVKKVNKWQCKVCNEKQSVKKVYGQGNSKDCRSHVQRLNSLQITAEQSADVKVQQASTFPSHSYPSVGLEEEENLSNSAESSHGDYKTDSKWSRYVQPKSKNVSSEEESEVLVPRFTKKQKQRQRGQKDEQSSSKWSSFDKSPIAETKHQQDYVTSTSHDEEPSDWNQQHNTTAKRLKVAEEHRTSKPPNIAGSKWGKYLPDLKDEKSDESDSEQNSSDLCAKTPQETPSYCDKSAGSSLNQPKSSADIFKSGLLHDAGDMADEELDELLNF